MSARRLLGMYTKLLAAFGPRNWWPADSPEEVILGAILTQNTSWANVRKALQALKEEGLLGFRQIAEVDEQDLARLVRSSGYFNQKARALKAFCRLFRQRLWLQHRAHAKT